MLLTNLIQGHLKSGKLNDGSAENVICTEVGTLNNSTGNVQEFIFEITLSHATAVIGFFERLTLKKTWKNLKPDGIFTFIILW